MRPLIVIRRTPKIDFMRWHVYGLAFSVILTLLTIGLFAARGLNYGIDFVGGTLIEVRVNPGPADLAAMRTKIDALHLGEPSLQAFGNANDVLIRLPQQPGGDAAQQTAVEKVRKAVEDGYEIRRTEVVGPRVSGELVQSGTLGVVMSIIAVLAYLWFRFEWQFAVGAVIATMHDLLLTVGFFSITQLEFNTTSIAAILTIVGYSLNETVVVLDRIREMIRKYKRMSTADIIDLSVNAVLPRTIMTATTVFLALLSLVIFGGQVIRSFSLAMMWGIFVATYSSVFICSPMLIYLGLRSDSVEPVPAPEERTETKPRAKVA